MKFGPHDNFPQYGMLLVCISHSQTMVAFHSGFRSAHHAPEDVEVDVRNNLKLLKLDYLDCLQVFYQTMLLFSIA